MATDDVRAAMIQAMTGSAVPDGLREGLAGYLIDRILPGSFLQAVLCNDLAEACRRADPDSSPPLATIAPFSLSSSEVRAVRREARLRELDPQTAQLVASLSTGYGIWCALRPFRRHRLSSGKAPACLSV